MEQRIVMLNLVQCWRCKQYIPPGQEIRARTMRTAVEQGSGLNSGQIDRYEPVSLCVPCDEAVAIEEQKRREQSDRKMRWIGWLCGGFFMMIVFISINAPWPVAVLGAGLLAWLGILGRTILALFVVINTLLFAPGKSFVDAHDTSIIVSVIAVIAIGKFLWPLFHSLSEGKTNKKVLPGPQTTQGNV